MLHVRVTMAKTACAHHHRGQQHKTSRAGAPLPGQAKAPPAPYVPGFPAPPAFSPPSPAPARPATQGRGFPTHSVAVLRLPPPHASPLPQRLRRFHRRTAQRRSSHRRLHASWCTPHAGGPPRARSARRGGGPRASYRRRRQPMAAGVRTPRPTPPLAARW